MQISVFHRSGSGGICRGIQVAKAIGAKINPKEGYENDLCIYAKVIPLVNIPKHAYMDVNDAPRALHWMQEHPEVGVIAVSEVQKEYLEKELGRKDIHLIPHHHCNYERFRRVDRPVEVVGIIGSQNAFQFPIKEFRNRLKGLGLTLKYDENYWEKYGKSPDPRKSVIDFYKTIDIQVAWRPTAWSPGYDPLRNPLKLSNAGSFGIPTIAYPEPSYMREWAGSFIPAKTIEDVYHQLRELKTNPTLYKIMSERTMETAEKYHMDHIKQLYLKLP